MKTKITVSVLLVLVLVAAFAFAYQTVSVSRAQGATSCTLGGFQASVENGPDKNVTVNGDLKLTVAPDGAVSGVLSPTMGGADIQVAGQANGRAINLAFDLGKDKNGIEQFIFGVGTLWYDVKDCKGPLGGPFIGPNEGDSGEWLVSNKPAAAATQAK